MKNIVVFASGYGSNFQSIIDAVESGKIHAVIKGLVVNKAGVKAQERAGKHKIPVQILNPRSYSNPYNYSEAMLQQLKEWDPDLIVLAGYLLKVPEEVVNAYTGKIINIHPSLLPKYSGKGFYGLSVHRAVLESGDNETGCTIHIVDNIYDNGPILYQAHVPVYPNDKVEDISNRVRKKELEIYPEVISSIINKAE